MDSYSLLIRLVLNPSNICTAMWVTSSLTLYFMFSFGRQLTAFNYHWNPHPGMSSSSKLLYLIEVCISVGFVPLRCITWQVSNMAGIECSTSECLHQFLRGLLLFDQLHLPRGSSCSTHQWHMLRADFLLHHVHGTAKQLLENSEGELGDATLW